MATAQTLTTVQLKPHTRSPWRRFAGVVRSPVGLVGGVIVLVVIFCAGAAPWLAPHDPALISIPSRLLPPVWYPKGNPAYLLGTDQLGRDLLSRLIFGSRISVIVGVSGVAVSLLIGVTLGLISGYIGKFVDAFISRVLDTFMSVPFILLAMAVVGVMGPRQGGGVWTLIIVLGVTGWVNFAHVVRGEVLSVKQREYVESARSIGQRGTQILLRHILPECDRFDHCIGHAADRHGHQSPNHRSASWGWASSRRPLPGAVLLADSRDHLATSWWLATFPGVAISVTVLGTILLGDWLRDVLDPRQTT